MYDLSGINSRIDKFEAGWALAQHDTSVYTVRKNVCPKQTTTILLRHGPILLGQGPTYAIL